jgi:2-keto-4-pentenoate hydratase/2-oxohepta-3-ene-1,7-dioic acid hydratase in catechol pathway
MKIIRFLTPEGQVGCGRLTRPGVAQPLVGSLFAEHAFTASELPVARLLAPLEPPNIFCIGRNYRAHAAETGSALPEKPMVFMKPTTALIGPDEPIVIPDAAPSEVDYEAELAIVIGRRARHVSAADALDYVFGYTCANDVSARDCQRNDKQWARAKGFDSFCPLGPWIVTADELNPEECVVESRLNGQMMQSAPTREMVHSCRALVSYLSQAFTLLPGTLILTGTPEGVGMARTPPVFLKPGDRIEVSIRGLGTLSNPVARAGSRDV